MNWNVLPAYNYAVAWTLFFFFLLETHFIIYVVNDRIYFSDRVHRSLVVSGADSFSLFLLLISKQYIRIPPGDNELRREYKSAGLTVRLTIFIYYP